jgi:hypothetical protein
MTEPMGTDGLSAGNGADEERVFKLFGVVESEMMRLKKTGPPQDMGRYHQIIVGTLMPLMLEFAHYAREQARLLYELSDRIDGDGDSETQLREEDASKFEIVLTYAKAVAVESLKHLELDTAEHTKCMEIVNLAGECLAIVEERTLVEETDDETGQEVPAPSN